MSERHWHGSSLSDFATGKRQAGAQALALVLFFSIMTYLPTYIFMCVYLGVCIYTHYVM